MKKFEVGKKYVMEINGCREFPVVYEVVSRTAKTITVKQDGKADAHRLRILNKPGDGFKSEFCLPLGRYSMAPILEAMDIMDAE